MRLSAITGTISYAFLGFMVIWLMMSPAQARVTVYLEDDIKVTFASGSFDSRNFNGEMQDVAIFMDEHRLLTADEVVVETSGESGTADHVIELLQMKNVFFDDVPLSIKTILIQDMASDFFAEFSERSAQMNAITDTSHFAMTGAAYSANGVSMTIDRIASLPFTFGSLTNGDPFLTKLGIQVENVILTPLQNKSAFAHFLSATGESNLTLNMTQFQENEIKNGTVSSDMFLKTTMKGIGDLDAQIGLQMPLDSYYKLFMSHAYDDDLDDIEDVALDDMSIIFDDYGAVNAALQMSAIEQNVDVQMARDMTIMAMKAALGSFLPNSSKDLFPPLDKFVREGGQLRLSMTPRTPFPLTNAAQYIFTPDAAIKALNVKLMQTPHGQDGNANTLQKTKMLN